ncbi:hypothetical protein HANVADRAFT_54325 [Hanseniaspora valbyensis NRRL Y-1626]|uniref:phenylalanine--tRNA ligase n=2 Tax=Hanseniaspora valbyensis NRRL Y-1626 TaxID=766949 RepID=A0A1B7T7P2_9ASCO|nr:hypothetical protein HANVADRAFT_54325 [Hanseniaspora valbyensis NRRL Y-1626]
MSSEKFQLEILQELNKNNAIESTLKTYPEVSSQDVIANLKSLDAFNKIKFETIENIYYDISSEGQDILNKGSYELRLLDILARIGQLSLKSKNDDLELSPSELKLGQAKAFRNGWISKTSEGNLEIKQGVEKNSLKDETKEQLLAIQAGKHDSIDNKTLADLKKRKLIVQKKDISYKVTKGDDFSVDLIKPETELTSDMISSGSYKDLKFKAYNFNSQGPLPPSGALHPLNKIKQEFRQIFFNMGFTEMPSNQYVESSFWNFDALYVPQQHPARDLQDTFYLKNPLTSDLPSDKEYVKNIKAVHEQGAFDSIGYRYNWKEEEAKKLVLRTHTTSISTAMLHQLAKDQKPARLFSIERVFRNEAVDATHLAEFHQVEGVLADYNITLGCLIKFMEDFFSKMGVENLKFKPTYNPYTEPSMEIFSWHEGLKKWVEIGNSGMFRPEMLESMGLPRGLKVLGWGLSLERPTMIKYKVQNIRELLGHKVSLDFIENNPAARLDEDLYE